MFIRILNGSKRNFAGVSCPGWNFHFKCLNDIFHDRSKRIIQMSIIIDKCGLLYDNIVHFWIESKIQFTLIFPTYVDHVKFNTCGCWECHSKRTHARMNRRWCVCECVCDCTVSTQEEWHSFGNCNLYTTLSIWLFGCGQQWIVISIDKTRLQRLKCLHRFKYSYNRLSA